MGDLRAQRETDRLGDAGTEGECLRVRGGPRRRDGPARGLSGDERRRREGETTRPTLIEAVQYRFGAHTTADDPSVYRDDEEVERWKAKDPIPRLEAFLRERGILDDEAVEAIGTAIKDEVADAVEAAEGTERPAPADMFDHVHADRTERIDEQAAHLDRLRERYGDEELLE